MRACVLPPVLLLPLSDRHTILLKHSRERARASAPRLFSLAFAYLCCVVLLGAAASGRLGQAEEGRVVVRNLARRVGAGEGAHRLARPDVVDGDGADEVDVGKVDGDVRRRAGRRREARRDAGGFR